MIRKPNFGAMISHKIDGNVALQGFLIASVAATFWGIGNFITGLSSSRYHNSSSPIPTLDISIANLIGGVLALFFFSRFLEIDQNHQVMTVEQPIRRICSWTLASFAKAANTVLFVAATSAISAAIAASLENLYIIWVALYLCIVARHALSLKLLICAALVITAAAMILRFKITGFDFLISSHGIFDALLAGAAYAAYIISWNQVASKQSNLRESAVKTMRFLAATTVAILAAEVLYEIALHRPLAFPLQSISSKDQLIQVINGTYNIGATYFLISESSRRMRTIGPLANIIIAIAMSFAIAITMVCEIFFSDFEFSTQQILGFLLYCVAFTAFTIFSQTPVEQKK